MASFNTFIIILGDFDYNMGDFIIIFPSLGSPLRGLGLGWLWLGEPFLMLFSCLCGSRTDLSPSWVLVGVILDYVGSCWIVLDHVDSC